MARSSECTEQYAQKVFDRDPHCQRGLFTTLTLKCNPCRMLSDVGPLPNLVAPLLFAVFGATAGWWIQKQVRRRRLMKLGFSSGDLSSQERFFTRLGEI